jgi:hypothetical protein
MDNPVPSYHILEVVLERTTSFKILSNGEAAYARGRAHQDRGATIVRS